jgi:hypothetical protein
LQFSAIYHQLHDTYMTKIEYKVWPELAEKEGEFQAIQSLCPSTRSLPTLSWSGENSASPPGRMWSRLQLVRLASGHV